MLELRGNERRGMGDGITILFKKPYFILYVPGVRHRHCGPGQGFRFNVKLVLNQII